MTPDEAAQQLYQVDPEKFVTTRKQLADQARADGDRPLAKEITAFRRPTRVAWLINVLAHEQPAAITELLALGEQLAQAQRRMAGDDLRSLSGKRRTMIDDLAKRTVALGHDHGYEAPDTAKQEISQTLQAAMADPAVAEQLTAGRLTQTVVYGGFGNDDLAAALSASTTAVQAKAAATPKTEPADDADEEPAEDPAVIAERERLAAEAETAQRAAAEAEGEADAATTRADELADQVEQLRAQLRSTEADEREAREAARAARKSATQLRQAAAQAAAAAEA